MIAVYTAGATELLVAAVFAAAIMIACGALSEQEARDAIKWDVIVTIAAAFGMSKALQNSGVAGIVAQRLVRLAEISGTGRVGLLTAVYFATFLISNVVTNNAAAALMFPIAAEAAEKAGETLMSVSFLVMLAGVGVVHESVRVPNQLDGVRTRGYVFKDFLRFGVPMQVVQLVVSVTVIALGSSLWWVSWGASAVAFGATCAAMMWEKNPFETARECFAGRFRADHRSGARGRFISKTTYHMVCMSTRTEQRVVVCFRHISRWYSVLTDVGVLRERVPTRSFAYKYRWSFVTQSIDRCRHRGTSLPMISRNRAGPS